MTQSGFPSRATDTAVPSRVRHATVGMIRTALIVLALVAVMCGDRTSAAPPPGLSANRGLMVVRTRVGPGFRVSPVMAPGAPGSAADFQSMVRRVKPVAAINGTFYDESCRPLGDILINGKLVNRGHYPNAVGFTRDGRVVFLRRGKRGFSWRGCRSGIAAGPRLITHGSIHLDPGADGFSRRSLTISAYRSGIGVTSDGSLLLATSRERLTLAEFADSMKRAGAIDALNLDGGAACALYHNGRFLAYPMLPMTSIVAVCRDHR